MLWGLDEPLPRSDFSLPACLHMLQQLQEDITHAKHKPVIFNLRVVQDRLAQVPASRVNAEVCLVRLGPFCPLLPGQSVIDQAKPLLTLWCCTGTHLYNEWSYKREGGTEQDCALSTTLLCASEAV